MKWIYSAALAAAIALSGGAAYKFGKLEAQASAAGKIEALHADNTRLTENNHALTLAVAEQNKAVEIAQAKELAAKAAKEIAESHAAQLAVFSKGRMGKLQDALDSMNGCSDVLERYWELRQ